MLFKQQSRFSRTTTSKLQLPTPKKSEFSNAGGGSQRGLPLLFFADRQAPSPGVERRALPFRSWELVVWELVVGVLGVGFSIDIPAESRRRPAGVWQCCPRPA